MVLDVARSFSTAKEAQLDGLGKDKRLDASSWNLCGGCVVDIRWLANEANPLNRFGKSISGTKR